MIEWKRIAFDIETDGLYDECTKLWCIGVRDLDTHTSTVFHGDSLGTGLQMGRAAENKVGHNVLDFDIPAIEKLTGVNVADHGTVVDTVVLSRLMKPDFMGGHSVEAWGRRLNLAKMDFRAACVKAGVIRDDAPKGSEFWQWSEVMNRYCERDVEVTAKILSSLLAIASKDGWAQGLYDLMAKPSVRLEHQAQKMMSEQGRYGWEFDSPKAERLLKRMRQAVEVIDEKVQPLLPLRVLMQGTNEVKNPLLKSLKPSKLTREWMEDQADNVQGPFTRIYFEPVDLNSDTQVKHALLQMGWRPDDFTEKGSPKLTESSLEAWGGRTGYLVSRRLMYRHRIGLVKGILEHVREDGKVPAEGIAQGAVTGRVAHRIVANIPRVTSPMGPAIRSLFKCPEGGRLIGADASGLELRCLAHYLNDDEVTREILEGDIHQKNADNVGVDRNAVKTLTYGWLYGGGDAKLGKILTLSTIGEWHGTQAEGACARAALLESMNATKLIEKVAAAARAGTLKGIDGRLIPIREEHAALNTLLQSCGAIVMKAAFVKLNFELAKRSHLGARCVCFYHDEYQVVVQDPANVDEVGKLMTACITWAGKHYGLNVPLDSEYDVGLSWKATH